MANFPALTFQNGTLTQIQSGNQVNVGAGITGPASLALDVATGQTVTANVNGVTLLQVGGSIVRMMGGFSLKPTAAKTTAYTVSPSDTYIPTNSASTAFNVTLPLAATFAAGQIIIISDDYGQCAAHNVTILTTSGEAIDGGLSTILSANYAYAILKSDGVSKWKIIGTSVNVGNFVKTDGTTPLTNHWALGSGKYVTAQVSGGIQVDDTSYFKVFTNQFINAAFKSSYDSNSLQIGETRTYLILCGKGNTGSNDQGILFANQYTGTTPIIGAQFVHRVGEFPAFVVGALDTGNSNAGGLNGIIRSPRTNSNGATTNLSGSSLLIQPGVGTGTGARGNVSLYGATSPGSGTSYHTLTEMLTVNGTSIGINNNAPNASALIDFTSTTSGVLFPRMTTTQRNAIASPANGLVVYDSTLNAFWGYKNGAWADISTGGGGGGSPTGSASGDLGGSYPGPTVIGITLGSDAQGDIYYRNASGLTRLAAGTAGYYLATGGTGANPSWTALPTALPPNGSAGGDLTGTYPNPTLAKITLGSDAQGDIYYRNGSGVLARLAPGTAGYYLATNGAAANPSWTALPTALPPNGSAGGDLTGTYPNPTVANLAITAAKIANATITATQVAAANIDGVAGTASLRTLGTGAQQAAAGNDSRITGAIQAPGSLAQGDVLYYNGSAWARLGAGTAGYYLATNGAAANPSWTALPTALPPNGSAGGDLTGSYPNPTVAKITLGSDAQGDIYYRNSSGVLARLAPGTAGYYLATGGAAANPSWTALPTALPPNGSAGGDLTGTYPNPTVANLAITAAKIANATITATQVAAANIDGTAGTASLRTLGTGSTQAAAGNDSRITGAIQAPASLAQGDVLYYNGTAWARLGAGTAGYYLATNGAAANPSWTALPTALPPNGSAGGDLTGSYPNPTVAKITLGSDAQGDVYYRNGSGVLARLAPGTAGYYLATNGAAANPSWTALPTALPPNGSAGGDLTGTYPNPTLAKITLGSDAQGDIYYRNGSGVLARLAPGTAGYYLATGGAAANPSWTALPTALPPNGSAGGDLTGTYPNPTVANLAITAAKIANATITDTQVAAANIDGTAGTASLRTLGTGSTQALAGSNDALYGKLAGTQTFTGAKTFSAAATFTDATSPIITAKVGPASGQQHTVPAVTSDTFVLLAATQTLTNKTLTSPVINVTSDAQGDVYYRNGSGVLARLAPGTSGQALITGGAAANPAWAYPQTVGTGTGAVTYQAGAKIGVKHLVGGDFPYTATTSDYYLGVTTTASARVITLPENAPDGTVYVVKDESGGAGTNSITVQRQTADTIDGVTSYVIAVNYGKASFISNGADWFVLGG